MVRAAGAPPALRRTATACSLGNGWPGDVALPGFQTSRLFSCDFTIRLLYVSRLLLAVESYGGQDDGPQCAAAQRHHGFIIHGFCL